MTMHFRKRHGSSPVTKTLACILILLAPAAGAQGQDAWAVAKQAMTEADLVKGPASDGQIGDYLLANDRLRIIIDAPDRPHGFAGSGGNILDADAARRGPQQDEIKQIVTYFQDRFGSQAHYDTLEILAPGDHNQSAAIKVSGVYSADSEVLITTIYKLAPGEPFVHIETILSNSGTRNYPSFALGDALEWGESRGFISGPGFQLRGTTPRASWLAGQGEYTSYGWTIKTGLMDTRHGSGWSDPIVSSPALLPGGEIRYERYFFVGLGDMSTVVEPMMALRGETPGIVSGIAREAGTGQALAGVEILASTTGGKMLLSGWSDHQGRFRLALPKGKCILSGRTPGRASYESVIVRANGGESASADITLTAEGRIRFTVSDDKGALIPAKLTFLGQGDTLTPDLGPPHRAAGAGNVLFTATGQGEGLVPPGDYEVVVSRGPEYNVTRQNVTLSGGTVVDFYAVLYRTVDTRGWISADLHVHTRNSFDCRVSLEDRVTSLVAEHVEFAVSADHDHLTNFAGTINALKVQPFIKSCVGVEVSTRDLGHFNVFPLSIREGQPGNGAIDHEGKTVREIYTQARTAPGTRIFQVNHPRAGTVGYFNAAQLDLNRRTAQPNFFWTFEALEVWNGKHIADASKNLNDLYGFYQRGHRPTATGGSDSHQMIQQEVGCPRTYIASREDAPDHLSETDIIAALKSGSAFVTNGPFISFQANGSGRIGDTIRLPTTGELQLRIKVQAADWVDVSQIEIVESGVVTQTIAVPPATGVVRYEGQIKRKPTIDTWYQIIVRGTRSLSPVITETPEQPVTPFAFTNPIWVDVDGNGVYNPPASIPGALTPVGR